MPKDTTNERINNAGREIHDMLVKGLHTEQGTHVGTLLSSAARLAGTSLFRTFKLRTDGVEPGTPVLSEIANEKGPGLFYMLRQILVRNGLQVDDKKAGVKPPPGQEPKLTILEVQNKFQDGYQAIARKYDLNFEQAAMAGVLTCATIIFNTSKSFDPNALLGMAAYGFVEGTKACPPPLKKDGTSR